jgi:hypothetical protein
VVLKLQCGVCVLGGLSLCPVAVTQYMRLEIDKVKRFILTGSWGTRKYKSMWGN